MLVTNLSIPVEPCVSVVVLEVVTRCVLLVNCLQSLSIILRESFPLTNSRARRSANDRNGGEESSCTHDGCWTAGEPSVWCDVLKCAIRDYCDAEDRLLRLGGRRTSLYICVSYLQCVACILDKLHSHSGKLDLVGQDVQKAVAIHLRVSVQRDKSCPSRQLPIGTKRNRLLLSHYN